MAKILNKCNFCKYATTGGCMVTPSPRYCREANDEFYLYLRNKKASSQQSAQKSLRTWDKR